jgi:hypothetical protein
MAANEVIQEEEEEAVEGVPKLANLVNDRAKEVRQKVEVEEVRQELVHCLMAEVAEEREVPMMVRSRMVVCT